MDAPRLVLRRVALPPGPDAVPPITDFGPARDAWLRAQAMDLRAGMPMLLHAADGIGRTGRVAIGRARADGVAPAAPAVALAGSQPETPEQRGFVARICNQDPLP